MTRFRNLLVYCQGNPAEDTAVQRAAEMAATDGVRVKILGIVGDESLRRLRQMDPYPLALMRKRKEALEHHAESLKSRGVRVSVSVRFGRPSAEIEREIAHGDHDLVLKMANPGEKASRWRFIGDTAVRLMRSSPVPLWVTRREREGVRRILAAIDPVSEPARRALDDEVMALASELAASAGGELHVVHAWDTIVLKGRVSWQEARRYAASTYLSMRRELDDYLAKYDELAGHPERIHTPRGNPDTCISQTATRIGADVVVMGNFGRTGLSGYLIGNTAEKVLPGLNASIISVKPGNGERPSRSIEEPMQNNQVAGSASG